MSIEEKRKRVQSLLAELVELSKDDDVRGKEKANVFSPGGLEVDDWRFRLSLYPPGDFVVDVYGDIPDLPKLGLEDPYKDFEDEE